MVLPTAVGHLLSRELKLDEKSKLCILRTDRATFVSVKVAAAQGDILVSNRHLADAAIPVQDLHLTLFVLTLKEQDGSMQVK